MIISQPNVHAADFANSRGTPRLRQMLNGDDKRIRSNTAVRDVVGEMDADHIIQVLKGACGAEALEVDASSMFSHFNFFGASSRTLLIDELHQQRETPTSPTTQNQESSS